MPFDLEISLKKLFVLLLVPFITGLLTVSFLPGLSKVMIMAGLVLSFIFALYFFYFDLKIQPEIIFFLLWIVWSLTGVFGVYNMEYFRISLMTIVQMGVLIFLVAGITALSRSFVPAVSGIIIGVTILLFLSYLHGEFGESLVTDDQAASITDNANIFAQHLIYLVFGIFFFWERIRSFWVRFLFMLLFFLAVAGIIYSGSRQGFAGLLAFIFLWFIFCQSRLILRKPLYALSALILVSGAMFVLTDYVMTHSYIGKKIKYFESRDVGRLSLYREGLEMIIHHPIAGVGLNNFRVFSESGMYSHSDYIEVAANTGLVGFMLYFSFYLILWRRLLRLRTKTTDLKLIYEIGFFKASVLTILLLGFTKPNITSKITWIFLAGAAGYTWVMEHSSESVPDFQNAEKAMD